MLTPETISSPRWANAGHTAIDCVVKFAEYAQPLPFTAMVDDVYDHTEVVFNRCVAGEAGPIADYVAPPSEVPDVISDRQFFQQLALSGLITEDEAIDAVATGAIPAAMQAVIDALPSDAQFGAKMLLRGAVSFERHHPLVVTFGAAMGKTDGQIDDLWLAASTL